jgi:hypothetical protein
LLPRAVAEGWYYFSFDLARTPALVYMNLIIDEFVVALNGSLTDVSCEEVTALAASSGVPMAKLSQRPWGLLPGA